MEVTVIVATYGHDRWRALATRRAVPSAAALGVPVVHEHADTLHEARNGGLEQVSTEWACFLDADDELEPGYFEAMATGSMDVRAPAVRYVSGASSARRRPAVVPQVPGHRHACGGECLPWGNWLVVGALVRADLVRRVGGWRDWPIYEDWDLWLRCYLAGATFEAIPAAVYRAYSRVGSRNRAPRRDARLEGHRAIARANGVPVP